MSVLSFIGQHGDTLCSMLTLVVLAADQADITVVPTPGLLITFWVRAVTPIGVDSIFTRGTILARITFTFIDVQLTVHTCVDNNAALDVYKVINEVCCDAFLRLTPYHLPKHFQQMIHNGMKSLSILTW